MKKRIWKFRIIGGIVTLAGAYLLIIGYGNTITLSLATVVLIFGIAIWMMAKPQDYNSMTDMIAMISLEGKHLKIEDFYEAYKNVRTPVGTAWWDIWAAPFWTS